MEQKPTDELNELLDETTPDGLSAYFRENEKYLKNGEKAFYYYMKDVLDTKGIRLMDLYSFAGMGESYGGQILRMEKHTKDRDVILRLCIAGHFSAEETNRALKLYGYSELYAKEPRDVCLIVALNRRLYAMDEVNALLREYGFAEILPVRDASEHA